MSKLSIGLVILIIVLLFPMSNCVTIDRDDIWSNKPFAGTINGQFVGTDLCVEYWLKREKQPKSATYCVKYPLGISIFGYIYNVELISING